MSYSFCPKCGKKGKLKNNLCLDCLLEETPIPTLPELKKCKDCPAFFINNRWTFISLEILQSFLKIHLKKFSPKLLSYTMDEGEINLKVQLEIEGIPVEREMSITFNSGICDNCMKIKSDYYEAIIQLRGTSSYPEDKEIMKTKKTRNGIDLYFLTKKKALSYAKSFPKDYERKYSSSLVGLTSSGKPKKKYTILLRAPE